MDIGYVCSCVINSIGFSFIFVLRSESAQKKSGIVISTEMIQIQKCYKIWDIFLLYAYLYNVHIYIYKLYNVHIYIHKYFSSL